MDIRGTSKKIVRYFLEQAISCGDLREWFSLEYSELADALGLESEKYCRVCCQYLNGCGYITITREKISDTRTVQLNVSAIDFLESP